MALVAVVILSVWKQVGYNMIILIVGMRADPADLPRGRSRRWRRRLAAVPTDHVAAPRAGHAVRGGDHDDLVLQRVHPGLRPGLGRPGVTGTAGAGARLRHLRERVPLLQHGLRRRGGGVPVPDHPRADDHPVPVPAGERAHEDEAACGCAPTWLYWVRRRAAAHRAGSSWSSRCSGWSARRCGPRRS